jgi:phospholipid/cholesterol/gamma-HCH transport system permease protein
VAYGNVLGIAGGAVVGSNYFQISYNAYVRIVTESLTGQDILEGMVKSVINGGIIAIVACHRGFRARGGAVGVGNAITGCVVDCFVWIFIANYFVTFTMS